jgi:hypothetical protein
VATRLSAPPARLTRSRGGRGRAAAATAATA